MDCDSAWFTPFLLHILFSLKDFRASSDPVNFAESLPRAPTAGPRADARCRALGGWQGEGRSQARRFQPSHQHKPSGILSGFGQTSPGRLRSAAAGPPTSLGVTTHIKAWRFYCSIFQIGRLRGQKETKPSRSWWRDGDFFKLKVSLRRAPGSPPAPGADAWVLPRSPPAADLGWGKEKEAPASAGKRESTPAARPALPRQQSVSSQSAPAGGPSRGREAQASAREAAPPAPIPHGRGRSFARRPSTLGGTCADSAVPAASAAASGVGTGPGPGWGVRGSPGSLDCRGPDSHGRGPRLPATSAGQGAIFSWSCSPSWTDRTS